MAVMSKPTIYSVSKFNELVRDSLAATFQTVVVEGEVTGFRQRAAGNRLVFFEIKDQHARLTVFMLDYQLDVELEDGMAVQVIGSPSLFKKNSGFHLRAIRVQPVGEGALAKALQLLKAKLEKEGLFDLERKRVLPRFPTVIGLITSPDAAAYHDVLRVLDNRWGGLTIVFCPVQVQGEGAVKNILHAFAQLKVRTDIEAVILTRGGGSLEDLQSFNSESVARAIFASPSPVVVGVGHERDWTIADLVADVRAATPSNAAELIVPDRAEILAVVGSLDRTIVREMITAFESYRQRYQQTVQALWRGPRRWRERFERSRHMLFVRFSGLQQAIGRSGEGIGRLAHQTTVGLTGAIQSQRDRLVHLSRTIHNLSPQATLRRGYSITTGPGGDVLRSPRGISAGDQLRTRLSSGSITSITKATHD